MLEWVTYTGTGVGLFEARTDISMNLDSFATAFQDEIAAISACQTSIKVAKNNGRMQECTSISNGIE